MDKENVVCVYIYVCVCVCACVCVCVYVYYSTFIQWNIFQLKKEEIRSFAATWMNLEGIMLSEISQTEKDKYCMISLICGI